MSLLEPLPPLVKPEHLERLASMYSKGQVHNTQRMYLTHQREFDAWLEKNGYPHAPETACIYIAELDNAGLKTATIDAKIAAIRKKYQALQGGMVTDTLRAMKNKRASAQVDGSDGVRGNNTTSKAHFGINELRQVCQREAKTLTEIRNRALITLGFWLAARRSELVALNVDDLRFNRDGLEVRIVRSKADQTGEGMWKPVVAVPEKQIDAVTAVKAWIAAAGISKGPLFVGTTRHGKATGKRITDQVVALVVKAECERIGLDGDSFAGHSLRSGLVTTLREAGVEDKHTKTITGHKTDKMLDHYDKRGNREAIDAIKSGLFNRPK